MAGKSLKRIPTAPMQKYAAVPITDPAEIAELEAKLKRCQDAERPVRTRGAARISNRSTTADLLELAEQLSAQSRVHLTKELAAQLSADEQFELVKQLVAQLPADHRQRLR
jgi:hypothetical protein